MPGRQVRDPHRGVGLVHVLAAGAARAVRVDAQVALVDLDLAVVREQRADDHLRERRVPPVRAVERRLAHEPVHAALGLERPVRVLALDRERRRLEPGLLARARLDELRSRSRGPRPSAGTSAAASRPSPASRCRPRPHGSSRRRRSRRTRPLKSASSCSRSSSARTRLERAGDLVGHVAVHRRAARARRRTRPGAARSARAGARARACSDEIFAAAPWSSQKPGSPMRASSSATRSRSVTGSKVITDPGELGPDLLELLLGRQCGRRLGHRLIVAARAGRTAVRRTSRRRATVPPRR